MAANQSDLIDAIRKSIEQQQKNVDETEKQYDDWKKALDDNQKKLNDAKHQFDQVLEGKEKTIQSIDDFETKYQELAERVERIEALGKSDLQADGKIINLEMTYIKETLECITQAMEEIEKVTQTKSVSDAIRQRYEIDAIEQLTSK